MHHLSEWIFLSYQKCDTYSILLMRYSNSYANLWILIAMTFQCVQISFFSTRDATSKTSEKNSSHTQKFVISTQLQSIISFPFFVVCEITSSLDRSRYLAKKISKKDPKMSRIGEVMQRMIIIKIFPYSLHWLHSLFQFSSSTVRTST